MKQYIKLIVLFTLLSPCVACATSVSVKLKVIDEQQQPVADVDVRMAFLLGKGKNSRSGMTDQNGIVEVTDSADFGVSMAARKEGYYTSMIRTGYGDQNVTLLLREKKNPIAMYAKKTLLSAIDNRKSGVEFGFDLMVGDFVSPYGKGQVNDLIITHTYSMPDFWNRESKMVIKFSNPDDGLLPFYFDEENITSEFKSTYTVPVEGYNNERVLTSSRKGVGSPVEGNMDARRNYYLRIRSKRDEDGNVILGYYGKIYGEFPEVTYYLNPTPNDRNVEFDMKNNLLRNLKNEERPRAP